MAAEAFSKHEVVPDVLASAPSKIVSVKFNSGVEVSISCVRQMLQFFNSRRTSAMC